MIDALRRVKIHGQLFVFFLHEAIKYRMLGEVGLFTGHIGRRLPLIPLPHHERVNHGKPPPEGDSTGKSRYTIIILIVQL